MAGLPDEIANRQWRTERAVPMADALDALLTHLETEEEQTASGIHTRQEATPDPELPLSTGIIEVDRALGGGLRQRHVTVVEAELAAQADALLWSIARSIPHPAVVDVDFPLGAVAWIWAGGAGVAPVSMTERRMTPTEWERATSTIGELANRDVGVSGAASVHGLAATVASQRTRVLMVQDIERFGDTPDVLHALASLASSTRLCVLATSGAHGDASHIERSDVSLVQMLSSDLGGRARIVRTDHIDMLAVHELRVDLVTGRVD